MNNIPNFSTNPSDRSWPELLAGYVLGDLSSDEMGLVQAHLDSNPDAISEVEELKTTLGLLPLGLDDIPVPAGIKTGLFAALSDREKPQLIILPNATTSNATTSNPVESLQSKIQQRWFAGIGSIAAITLAALGLQSYQMQQEFSAMRQELARLRKTQEQVVAKSDAGDRYQESVAFMRQSGSRMLTMTGSGSVSGASGSVVIVPGQNRAILTVQKMPQPPIGKVYHLWAVVNNQKVTCVQFIPESNGQVLMQIPANRWNSATEVVITLESEESTSQPAGEMVMSGEKT